MFVRLLGVNVVAKQRFDRQRYLDRDEEPFEQSRLGQWKLIRVAFAVFDVVAFEDDDHSRFISPCVVLPDDPCLPEPPDVRHLVRQVRLNGLQCHPGFEAIVGNDFHGKDLRDESVPATVYDYS